MRSSPTLLLLSTLMLGACTTHEPWRANVSLAKLDATAWAQTAVEYDGICRQAWVAARHTLDARLAEAAALPPAVVVDCDETVLDNAPYQAWLLRNGGDFDLQSWGEWCADGSAPAIPGAVEFLQYAASRGVTVFYVTNREPSYPTIDVDIRAATARNLRDLGCPLDDPATQLLMRGDVGEGSDKEARRERIRQSHRIVLSAGDDLGDFLSHDKGGTAAREALLTEHADRFGVDWIVLPNAVYGSWERSLWDFERGVTDEEKLRIRRDALHSWR